MYIRVRGRVLGPYDQEKLQSLARRGQLSRMHELSSDGASWVRASNYPELFTGNTIAAPTPDEYRIADDSVATAAPQSTAVGAPALGSAPNQSGQWYYTSGGAQRGPVEFANLQLLCASGQVQAEDLVWSDGMPAWMPANRIPGLIRTASDGSSRTDRGEFADRVYRATYSSRPWVLFIAVAFCIYGVLEAIGGIWLMTRGARLQHSILVFDGILALVFSLDAGVGAYLLNVYAARMGNLQYNAKPAALEKSQEALRAFWIYLAINLIVFIVLIGITVAIGIAEGLTLPAGF